LVAQISSEVALVFVAIHERQSSHTVYPLPSPLPNPPPQGEGTGSFLEVCLKGSRRNREGSDGEEAAVFQFLGLAEEDESAEKVSMRSRCGPYCRHIPLVQLELAVMVIPDLFFGKPLHD
jgi:hypothetical protein